MVKGFSTKKIKLQKTLGELLKNRRIRKRLSISDAEDGTKIKAKYLLAIENSRWSLLPQQVYVRGFVVAYSKFLGMSVDDIVSLYENEAQISNIKLTKISYNQTIKEKKALITPKILAYCTLIVFVCVMVSYIIAQILHFTGAPNLNIISPENNALLEENEVKLAGVTDPDTFIIVNNENIAVTSDGHFQLNYKLQKGINVIKVKAINKSKKESSEIFTVEYKPKTALNNDINGSE